MPEIDDAVCVTLRDGPLVALPTPHTPANEFDTGAVESLHPSPTITATSANICFIDSVIPRRGSERGLHRLSPPTPHRPPIDPRRIKSNVLQPLHDPTPRVGI